MVWSRKCSCRGCGRKVAPGVTAKGKPYKTCCRGCVMGFGHDLHCGNIDPSMVPLSIRLSENPP
eukprot:3979741-Amphidinium_carterae.1